MCDLDDMSKMDELDPFESEFTAVRIELKKRIDFLETGSSNIEIKEKRKS